MQFEAILRGIMCWKLADETLTSFESVCYTKKGSNEVVTC